MDVQAALRWVRSNIERFAGDPGNVTLFGNWAGAQIVHLEMLAPGAKGLFHKAPDFGPSRQDAGPSSNGELGFCNLVARDWAANLASLLATHADVQNDNRGPDLPRCS